MLLCTIFQFYSCSIEFATFCTYFVQYLDLFLTRVDGLRRRILFGNEVENVLDYSLIRETFQVCHISICVFVLFCFPLFP